MTLLHACITINVRWSGYWNTLIHILNIMNIKIDINVFNRNNVIMTYLHIQYTISSPLHGSMVPTHHKPIWCNRYQLHSDTQWPSIPVFWKLFDFYSIIFNYSFVIRIIYNYDYMTWRQLFTIFCIVIYILCR